MAGTDQNTSVNALLEKMRNYTAPNPSPRNPRISKESSHADLIEAGYQADGHKTWGYVIYRTTYESDADWAEFMRRLRWWTTDSMEFYNGQDVLDRMTWTVFDDRERFDGADVATIRGHFRDWAETAIQSEQQESDQSAPISMGRSPRYRYCILVDGDALKSAVHEAPAPPDFDQDRQGWVKVIDKNWVPSRENHVFAGRPDPNEYEPIDGITEKHLGWAKCPFTSVMTEYYMLFRDSNAYTVAYRRPPAVVGYPWK